MKKLQSFLLISLILQSVFCFGLLPNNVIAQTQEKLTNQNIIDLVKNGFSNDVIIAKIKSSAIAFDTSLTALQELKNNGVADAVIVAMVEGNKPIINKSSQEIEVTIPDGTTVEVALKNDLSGQTAKVGDVIDFTVVRDVKIDGVTVIEKGSLALGKITVAEKARYWGRKGIISWVIQDVTTSSGEKIPVRFSKSVDGDSSRAVVAAATIATVVLFFPLAPLWGLKKGTAATVSQGNYYTVYVDGATKIKVKL